MKSICNYTLKTVSKFLLLLLLFTFPQFLNSQWISSYYGNSYGDTPLTDAHGTSVCTDNYGYCYVTGYVDEGSGNNILVIKYNSETGDTVWVRTFNGAADGDDVGNGIMTDASGNVYVTGAVTNIDRGHDVSLLKYSSDGTFLWQTSKSGEEIDAEDIGVNLTSDMYGNIYVTGYCTDTNQITDIITIKYNADGYINWFQKEDGPYILNASGTNIAVNNSGTNIYVIGYVTRALTGNDMVFIKYTLSGYRSYIRYFDGWAFSTDRAFGIAVDQSDNVYITGYSTTSVSGTEDFVLLKYNSSGTQIWFRTYNGEGNQSDRAFGIAVDQEDGYIYITGRSYNSAGNNDYLTAAYNPEGNLLWHNYYNGTANNDDEASAIGIVNNLNETKSIIVTGSSWGGTNNHDYVTLRYDKTTGALQSENRYSMAPNTEDVAEDLAVNDSNETFITGFSQLLGDGASSSSIVSTQKLGKFEGSELTTLNNTPSKLTLYQNYPNPFNPSTIIKFTIEQQSNVKLTVYDILGREVTILINNVLKQGTYSITFTTQSLSSGIYFYEIRAGVNRDVKKMTFIK